jgi:hypothetical protein
MSRCRREGEERQPKERWRAVRRKRQGVRMRSEGVAMRADASARAVRRSRRSFRRTGPRIRATMAPTARIGASGLLSSEWSSAAGLFRREGEEVRRGDWGGKGRRG